MESYRKGVNKTGFVSDISLLNIDFKAQNLRGACQLVSMFQRKHKVCQVNGWRFIGFRVNFKF